MWECCVFERGFFLLVEKKRMEAALDCICFCFLFCYIKRNWERERESKCGKRNFIYLYIYMGKRFYLLVFHWGGFGNWDKLYRKYFCFYFLFEFLLFGFGEVSQLVCWNYYNALAFFFSFFFFLRSWGAWPVSIL